MIKCPNCGTEARPNAKFCMNCGSSLDENAQSEGGSLAAADDAATARDAVAGDDDVATATDAAAGDAEASATDAASANNAAASADEGASSQTPSSLDDSPNPESAYEKSNAVSGAKAKRSGKSTDGKAAPKNASASSVASGSKPAGKAFSKKKKALIITVCIVAAALLVAGVIFLSMPRGTTTIGEGYEITGQRIAYSEGSYFIKGEAKNTTGHDEAFTLTYAIYNGDDEEIGNASCTVGPLNNGQSSEFEAKIQSNTTMFDLMMNGGQQEATGSPIRFELTNVALYTEGVNSTAEQFSQMFNMFNWFF